MFRNTVLAATICIVSTALIGTSEASAQSCGGCAENWGPVHGWVHTVDEGYFDPGFHNGGVRQCYANPADALGQVSVNDDLTCHENKRPGACSVHAEGECADESVLAKLEDVARRQDWASLGLLAADHQVRAIYNVSRRSLQVYGCNNEIIANFPVR
jgi:hypothetical protein